MHQSAADAAPAGEADVRRTSELADRLRQVVGDSPYTEVAAATGVSDETVRRYMKSGRTNVAFLATFAEAYGIRIHWLLTGEGPRYQDGRDASWVHDCEIVDLLTALEQMVAPAPV